MIVTGGEKRDTIVLGASAGGIEALQKVLAAFTLGVEASILVVLHLPADGHSLLDLVLGRATPYKSAFPRDGEVILPRHVYVAPPDRHLLVNGDNIRLWPGPRENRSRPAINPLFRSAAVARRGRVIAGVLSGLLDDGTAGLVSVKRCGGLAFVQAPDDALEPEMPAGAARALGDDIDGVLPAHDLGRRMAELVGTPAAPAAVPADIRLEMEMLLGEVAGIDVLSSNGPPLPLSCPECGGPLWGIVEGRVQRFRCHTGHAYSTESLLAAQGVQIEQALWAAIKGLEQRSQMLSSLASDESLRRRPVAAGNFELESKRLRAHAQTLREVLVASLRNTRREALRGSNGE